MSRISLQFHATPDELVDLAAEWAENHGLFMAVERFFPEPQCIVVTGLDVATTVTELNGVWNRIWFSKQPLPIDYSSKPPFAGDPECLALAAGDLSHEGLRESAIGAVSEEAEVLGTWREVMKSVKARMLVGAWITNPRTGARQRMNGHYFTRGALALSQSGVKMLAFAGWNEFEFDLPKQ